MHLFTTACLLITISFVEQPKKVEPIPAYCLQAEVSPIPVKKKAPAIDYLTDQQVAEFERHGVHHNLGKLIKHRDDTGGIHTITWEEEK